MGLRLALRKLVRAKQQLLPYQLYMKSKPIKPDQTSFYASQSLDSVTGG
jgi:hypothetical protein